MTFWPRLPDLNDFVAGMALLLAKEASRRWSSRISSG
jgi:hypothetical protein